MNPGDRISTIKGIGAKTESHLARIGIYTVGDMAEHYPREYHAYDTPVSIENTEYDNLIDQGYRLECINDVRSMIETAKSLNMKYDSVITNPPYIGNKFLPARLKDYIEKNYKDYKSDIFAAFIARIIHMTKLNGNIGMLTPYVWMFISTYEELRRKVLNETQITSLVQLEYNAFEAACVPVCSFTLKKTSDKLLGEYVRLSEFKGADIQGVKVIEAVNNRECGYRYTTDQRGFDVIPGAPVAYWVDKRIVENFNVGTRVDTFAFPKQGLATADNNRFLRLWFEVSANNVAFVHSKKKWYPFNKGGEFRRWYGNREYILLWENDGQEIKNFKDTKGKLKSRPQNLEYNFKPALSWSLITSGEFSVRYYDENFAFNVAGISCFPEKHILKYLCGILNSKVVGKITKMLNPTLNMNVGDVAKVPIWFIEKEKSNVEEYVDSSIAISKKDWDSFETSWDFRHHSLIRRVPTIAEAFEQWQAECDERFNQLKANEEELNRIFIDIYGLQEELTPEVEDKDITVRKADLGREIRSFISYAVGCMFGRYSLDVDGLAYAGGEWDASKYASFAADKDNIIPICDDEYFEDDIVGLFVEFVKTVYGADTLDENLKFIADALGGKGQPKDVIRNYFLNDFYKDHCKIYQKRPIYWLFDSGKKNGFKCLIYMHRYQPDTIARIRTDYVHEQQSRYRTAVADIEQRLMGASGSEKVKLDKQKATLQAQITEIGEYEERIHHLADQMIRIDLDDGVKNNYEIFKDVLAKIK